MKCAGDKSQICGGPNGLSLYQTNSSSGSTTSSAVTANATSSTVAAPSSSKPAGPTVVPSALGYSSMGCYSEKANGRVLAKTFANDSMTIESCAAQALKGPYLYFGVEYG